MKGPSIGKSLTPSSNKGVVAKKARFSFDAQTEGKTKAGNGHHPAEQPQSPRRLWQVSTRET